LKDLKTPQEMSGLLNWALEGLERLFINKKFSNETNANSVRKYWMRKSNSVAAFIEDCVELDYDSRISKKEFRKAYHDYCKKNNLKQMGDLAINITLSKELGLSESQIRTYAGRDRIWEGIRFTNNIFLDKTELIIEQLKIRQKITFKNLQLLIINKHELVSCLNILEKEGSILELPAGTWRLAE
jgi:hypothetical protein